LTKVLPTYGEAARPLDLFDKDRPELFALHVQKDFSAWWLVGYFNWDEEAEVRREFALSRLGLDISTPYLVYDFWEQRLLAETSSAVRLHFAPASVRLLAIHARRGVPQVLGTDRHYTQGAVELLQVGWDTTRGVLSGTGLGAPGLSWTMTIYVPTGFAWDYHTNTSWPQSAQVSVLSYEEKLLRVRLQFGDTDQIHWAVPFSAAAEHT
jgi:hypothetical protein